MSVPAVKFHGAEHGCLHLFGGRTGREIPPERLGLDFQIFLLVAFDFGHDLRDATIGQRIILAEPAETLCLRKGRCKLIAGHDFAQNFLLVIVEIGKLHRGSQRDPSLIHQF